MKDSTLSIEMSKAGPARLSTGKDVLDWRKTSVIHKSWEKKESGPLVGRLRKFLFAKEAQSSDVEANYTLERHHNYNGRPWCLGRDHINYLIGRGLKPNDFFLDLGCGAMRTGIWVTRYLDSGRYFGIDAHLPGLEAAARYEVPLHGLRDKQPRLLNDDSFDIGHFEVKFDWIFAFAVVNHLSDARLDTALTRIHEHLNPTGRLVLSPAPRKPLEWLEKERGLKLCHSEQTNCLLIDDTIDWFEFRPVPVGS